MSGKIVGMVFDHYPHGGNERLLAVKLADNAHDDGTSIYPSVATLAEQTCQSERSVQYQLKRMLEMGWLVLVKEARGGGRGGGFGRPREYRINPVWVKAYDSRVPCEARPKWEPLSIIKPRKTAAKASKEMGAKVAPISSPPENGKWVQPGAEMGATAVAEMGATAGAPEPSLTVIEQITPQPPADAGGSVLGFDDFFAAYPRKEHEERARRRWESLDPDPVLARQIVVAVRAQLAGSQWRRLLKEQLTHFIPLPGNWLRNSRWLDVVEVPGEISILSQWWLTTDGVQARGAELGLPYSLKALGNSYTSDDVQAHNRRYRAKVFELAGDGPWRAPA